MVAGATVVGVMSCTVGVQRAIASPNILAARRTSIHQQAQFWASNSSNLWLAQVPKAHLKSRTAAAANTEAAPRNGLKDSDRGRLSGLLRAVFFLWRVVHSARVLSPCRARICGGTG